MYGAQCRNHGEKSDGDCDINRTTAGAVLTAQYNFKNEKGSNSYKPVTVTTAPAAAPFDGGDTEDDNK